MAIKVTTTGQTTFVKKVTIGTPIRKVSSTRSLSGLSEINLTGKRHIDIFVYDSSTAQYVSSYISAPGFDITYSSDSDKILLSLSQINGGTY